MTDLQRIKDKTVKLGKTANIPLFILINYHSLSDLEGCILSLQLFMP